jgi:hypothetical protein
MTARQTVLRAALQARHLQEYRAFCRRYQAVARSLEGDRASQPPSKATFYRWLSGTGPTAPHPDHCRVLEAMFPGRTVSDLLSRWDGTSPLPALAAKWAPSPDRKEPNTSHFADLSAAFTTRSEFIEQMPPRSVFDRAAVIQASGLSLNLLCQHYGDSRLRNLVHGGTRIQALFLDPDGAATRDREREEGHPPGALAALTRLNIGMLKRIRDEQPEADKQRLELRTYDETIRFNITIVDERQCIAQPYLPRLRGVDSPTFVVTRRGDEAGMFATFGHVFEDLWPGGTPV